jgi:hypothetical protein
MSETDILMTRDDLYAYAVRYGFEGENTPAAVDEFFKAYGYCPAHDEKSGKYHFEPWE